VISRQSFNLLPSLGLRR